MSDAMRVVRSQGMETSVQVKLRDLASRNSSKRRSDKSLIAAASLLSQYMSSSSRGVPTTLLWAGLCAVRLGVDFVERELEIGVDQSKMITKIQKGN